MRVSDTLDLTVRVYGGDGDRFAWLFRQAIAGLPDDVVESIDRYWQPITDEQPLISLELGVIRKGDGSGVALGMHEESGKVLRFCGSALAEMPDELGVSLIVHELAHVHAYAEVAFDAMDSAMRQNLNSICHDLAALEEALERYADTRMQEWGHDPDALRRWCDAYLRRLGLIV
jgi:hypothetical protein